MTDVQTQSQTTPARRRQTHLASNPRGRKAYASENDVSSIQNSRGPQTPQRRGQHLSQANDENSRQQSKQKSRSKHAPSSPESGQQRQERHTPVRQVSGPPKSATEAAFAGATFHASPSPASLPMPSFLSRVASDPPSANSNQQQTSPSRTNDVLTPQRTGSEARSIGSPLDFMFRAHREEQDKQRRGSANDSRSNLSYMSPSPSHTPVQSPESNQHASSSSRRQRPGTVRSRSFFDGSEIDEEPYSGIAGPAFSTPYQDRIRAAQAGAAHQTPPASSEQSPQDPTEALKRFLFGGKEDVNNRPMSSPGAGLPSSTQPVSIPGQQADQSRTQNIRAMENDLRRILKMDG